MKVVFFRHYKNGQLGIEAGEGDVLSLKKAEIEQIASDVRNPDDTFKVLSKGEDAEAAVEEQNAES